jgi:hypothetical protein
MMACYMNVSPPDTMDRVEAAMVGAVSYDASDVRTRIASVFEGTDVRQADALMGVTTDDLSAAVAKAVSNAWG